MSKTKEPAFKTGLTVMTRGVADRIETDASFAAFVTESLSRYLNHDWGDLSKDDARANDDAVANGDDRILAAYKREGFPADKIWIITEWDRSSTTVLFPDEY